MPIVEKQVQIDDEGTDAAGHDLQRFDAGSDDGRPRRRLRRTDADQSRIELDAAQHRLPCRHGRAGRRRADADQSRRAGETALQGDAHGHLRLPLRSRRRDDPLARRVRHERHDHGAAARRPEEREGRTAPLRQGLLRRRERLLHPARRGRQLQDLREPRRFLRGYARSDEGPDPDPRRLQRRQGRADGRQRA